MYNPEACEDRVHLATSLERTFQKANFSQIDKPGCSEKVFAFSVEQIPNVFIYVYSTIVGEQVRSVGADAIRVTVVYKRKDAQEMQLFAATRVFRTGEIDAICERTLSRMREAFATLRERSRNQLTCKRCSAPLFDTKKNTMACAATCWV